MIPALMPSRAGRRMADRVHARDLVMIYGPALTDAAGKTARSSMAEHAEAPLGKSKKSGGENDVNGGKL